MSLIQSGNSAEKKAAELFFIPYALSKSLTLTLTVVIFFIYFFMTPREHTGS